MNGVTRELLQWVASAPRTYAETMESWTGNCPRHPAWDDAATARLVTVRRGRVVLTARGRAALEEATA